MNEINNLSSKKYNITNTTTKDEINNISTIKLKKINTY